jgi:hypothetical protein
MMMARRKRQENAGGFSLLPKKDAKQGAKQAKQGFLVFLVAAFCIAIAAKLGAFEPYFFLQKTPALVVGCLQDQVQLFAYSKSNFVLLPLHKNAGTTSASFFGRGQADSVKIHKADENESI